MPVKSQNADRVPPVFQHTVSYWVLTGMAGLLLVPCVLLPVYAEYSSWRSHRAAVEAGIEQLNRQISHNEMVIDALCSDPGVNARILSRELGYRRPSTQAVPVLQPSAPEGLASSFDYLLGTSSLSHDLEDAPVNLQPWEMEVEHRLARASWIAVFVEPASRHVILVMSAGLLVAALLLFPARRHEPGI